MILDIKNIGWIFIDASSRERSVGSGSSIAVPVIRTYKIQILYSIIFDNTLFWIESEKIDDVHISEFLPISIIICLVHESFSFNTFSYVL